MPEGKIEKFLEDLSSLNYSESYINDKRRITPKIMFV